MIDSIQYGDTEIRYLLKKSSKRKTLSITVAEQSVEVAAPSGLCPEDLKIYVKTKAPWILAKLDENKQVPPVYPRQMQSGETVHYLGRQFTLKIINDATSRGVRMWRGQLVVSLKPDDDIKTSGEKLVKIWYKNHLRDKLKPGVIFFGGFLRSATVSVALIIRRSPDFIKETAASPKEPKATETQPCAKAMAGRLVALRKTAQKTTEKNHTHLNPLSMPTPSNSG